EHPVTGLRIDLADGDAPRFLNPRLAGVAHPGDALAQIGLCVRAGDRIPVEVALLAVVIQLDVALPAHEAFATPEIIAGDIGHGHRNTLMPAVIVGPEVGHHVPGQCPYRTEIGPG